MSETTTTVPAEVIAPTVLTDKTIDWLLRNAASGEEGNRALIQATIDATQRTKKRVPATELADAYAVHNNALVERIYAAQEVAHNTLRKMTCATPPSLAWATIRSTRIYITGISRHSSALNRGLQDITNALAQGTTSAAKHDVVHFVVGKVEGEIPLSLLGNDPIAVAQYVRRICKSAVAAEKFQKSKTAVDNHKSLKAKLAQAQREFDKSEQELERLRLAATPKPRKVDSRIAVAV